MLIKGLLPLKKNKDFRYIYNNGKSIFTKNVVMYFMRSKNNGKVGFVVSKKVGKATVRNRNKRLIKEAFRNCNIDLLDNNIDIIFLARPNIVNTNYDIIKKDISYLIKKANKLLSSNQEIKNG